MSNDASKRRGWRTAAAGAAAGKSDQGKRAWQQSAEPAPTAMTPGKKRKIKLFAALGALAVIIGALVALVLWPRPPKTACLVLIGAGYETNMAVPHNAAGWNALMDLHSMAEAGGGLRLPWVKTKQLRLHLGPTNVRAQTNWDEEVWPKLLKRPDEATMILFLSMHGGGDKDGAYLLADDPYVKKKVYVDTLIEKLKDPVLEGKNKVLILDTSHIVANWQSGILSNEFAGQLKKLQKKIENIPNLIVLCSNDVDQHSWVSPEWQRTIFAHYVIEGLKGAADRGDSENMRVTTWELFQYVKDRVATWTDVNRDKVQIPFMLGSESTAKAIELAQVKEKYNEESYTQAANYDIPFEKIRDKIDTHWSSWEKLRKNIPHPAVYSPHEWRHYQDMLIRYEELVRLGDPTKKAEQLSTKLTELARDIGQWRQPIPNAQSLANALPMSSVLGTTPPWDDDALRRRYQNFMSATDDKKWEDTWTEFVAWYNQTAGAQTSSLRPLLVLEFTKIALQTTVDNNAITVESLKRTSELLQKFFDRQNRLAAGKLARNAEGHYAVMLNRDHVIPPKSPNESLLQLALQVRLLAEETAFAMPRKIETAREHPYSEVIWRWIQDKVEKADADRRMGEDLLFGELPIHWDNARDHLQDALKQYELALADAAVLRDALKTRDLVAAQLPYFARWAAGRTEKDDEDLNWIPKIEQASKNLETLITKLDEKNSKNLSDLTRQLKDGLKKLQDAFTIECNKLRDVQLHAEFHRIQNALSVPLLTNRKLRFDLVRTSSTTSSKFHQDEVSGGREIADKAKVLEALARQRAKNEARMALAASGTSDFGDLSYGQLHNQIINAVGDWRVTLRNVGEEIQAQWRRSLKTIQQNWVESIQQPNLGKAGSLLEPAEHVCRFITVGDVDEQIPTDTLGGSVPVDPVQGARRLRLYQLLAWQAKRTWLDHWFLGSGGPNETFYAPTCRAYLKDAEALAAGKSGLAKVNEDRKKPAADLAKRYTRVIGLNAVVQGGDTQHLIGDKNLTVRWSVKPGDDDLPKGDPVYWVYVSEQDNGTFKDIDKQQPTQRMRMHQNEDVTWQVTTQQLEAESVPLVPTQKNGEVKLRVLFRGQRIDVPVAVKVQDVADVIASRFPPDPSDRAKVAVFMKEGDYYGAACIALDFSGSMRWNLKGQDTSNDREKRIRYVRDVFEKALRDTIPKGTPFSIIAFNSKGYNPRIELFRPPISWQQNEQEIKDLLVKFDHKFRSEVEDVSKRDRDNVGTPITKTLVKAAEEGFPKGFKNKGPKILFVLTDGHDTIDKVKDNKTIHNQLLKTFGSQDSDIQLNIVCFAEEESEDAKNAKKQFKMIEEFGFPKPGIRGNLNVEPDPKQLIKAMEEALRPKLQLKRGKDRVFKKGLIVRPKYYNREFSPFIPVPFAVSQYKTFIPNTPEKDLLLSPGELVLLEVYRRADEFLSLRQPIFGEFIEKTRRYVGRQRTMKRLPEGSPEWAATVLQHQYNNKNASLTQLLSIESLPKNAAKLNADLRHLYPSLVWLEVETESGQPAKGLRWHQAHGYPAPAFRLHAARFAPAEKPKLKVWFLGSNPAPGIGMSGLTLADLKSDVKKDIAGARIRIRKSEKEVLRYVSTGPKRRSQKNCIVFQVDYDPARPVIIQQEQTGSFPGEEHRFFTKAGRYTALFWGWDASLDLNAVTFRIVSVQRMKNDGNTMRYHPSLERPAAENRPPDDFSVQEFQK